MFSVHATYIRLLFQITKKIEQNLRCLTNKLYFHMLEMGLISAISIKATQHHSMTWALKYNSRMIGNSI